MPLDLLPNAPEGTGVTGIVAAIIGIVLWLRRRVSRDGLEMSKDSAETTLILTLQAERDKAMDAAERAWSTRTEDAKLIGKLSSEVESLTRINMEMREQMREMKMELHAMHQQINELHRTLQGNQ